MKAYMTFSRCPSEGCELVYANNRNEAKKLSTHNNFEWEYIDINTKRIPHYDKYSDSVAVFESNDDLPDCAPDFFLDEIY